MTDTLAIDFGTAAALAAVMPDSKPQVLSGLGTADSFLFPTVMAFEDDHSPLFGWEALKRRTAAPLTAVASVKRLLATGGAELAAAAEEHYFPYAVHAEKGMPIISAGGRSWKPAEIAGRILEAIKNSAEKKTGKSFTRVILTQSACFDEAASAELREAAGLAGFKQCELILESSAVALAWAAERPEDGMFGVYNLGAGFFEAALFENKNGVIRCLARDCAQIGGEDFSWQTARFFLDDLGNPALAQDPVLVQRLYEEAERAKCALSHRGSCDIRIEDAVRKIDYLKAFSRYELGTVVNPLVDQTREAVENLLSSAKLKAEDIKVWLPAGGSTRMPIVREALRLMTGKRPEEAANPDHLAVTGACIHGAALESKQKTPRLADE